jgi:hypothetical protein
MQESPPRYAEHGHIRQREAWDMFERIRNLEFTVRSGALSMAGSGTDICAGRSAALPGASASAWHTRHIYAAYLRGIL